MSGSAEDSGAKNQSLRPPITSLIASGVPLKGTCTACKPACRRNFSALKWVALVVPAATPAAVVARLQQEAAKALATPELIERLAKLGAEPMVMPTAEFNAFLRAEVESAARIVKAADLKAQ